MANKYVYSGAGGAGTGADWANAYATLATGGTGSAAGDDIWVASDHAESTGAAQTITLPGTAAAPNRVISVDRAGSVPPVAADILAGGSVTTTGAFGITIAGVAYIYGLTINTGTGATTATLTLASSTTNWLRFDTCALNLLTTAAGSRIVVGGASTGAEWTNCTCSFGAVTQGITITGNFRWANKPGSPAITGATIPTTLFITGVNGTETRLSGLDLSAAGAGKTLVGTITPLVAIQNCKLDASVTAAATPAASSARGVRLLNSHTSGNAARNEIYLYHGTLTTETTIVRTGGASDGTTAYSWKIVPTANNRRELPFETFEGVIWNNTLSAQTLTIHCVTDNVPLTDAEIWVEVEYLASSATPVTTLITDANATVLTTPANQNTAGPATWTTTGLGTPVYQKLEATFTSAMTGPIRWRVKYGKASTTVYVCPKAELS